MEYTLSSDFAYKILHLVPLPTRHGPAQSDRALEFGYMPSKRCVMTSHPFSKWDKVYKFWDREVETWQYLWPIISKKILK